MSGQGVVVWFTGLPASGKTTLAERVRASLPRTAVILDGDEMRSVLDTANYGAIDRERFYRVLANLAAMLARQGVVVLVPATAQHSSWRDFAREVAPKFVEVWVRTPIAECAARDPKGLYAGAAAGEIARLPGVGVPYEAPGRPEVIADGGHDDAAVLAIRELVGPS